MSSQPPRDPLDPQSTQPMRGDVPPPPSAPTEQIFVPPPPPPPGRFWVVMVLLVFAGTAAGFALGHFVGRPPHGVPDANLILFEPASSTFPVPGAEFTASAFDERRGSCDKAKLKQFLRADPRRFKAWLKLVGIGESEFDSYVDRLQMRILPSLTPVTNHGCYGSAQGQCPFAVQSVLAAGTPVWWDPIKAQIVAKCRCSNPLAAPVCPPNCGDAAATTLPSTSPPTAAVRTTPPATSTLPPPTEAPTPSPAITPEPIPTETPFP
jgi:hypothetical protein